MRKPLAVSILALLPLASCAHHADYPDSPVPAALTDLEAARVADEHFIKQHSPALMLQSAEQDAHGWLLAYTSVFDPTQSTPPKASHLVIVENDGKVREIKMD